MATQKKRPRKAAASPWDKSLRSVFEDRSAPVAVRVAAVEALTECVRSLDAAGQQKLLTWASKLKNDRKYQDWRIRFRLEVLASAIRSSGKPTFTAKWTMDEHWKDLSKPALTALGWQAKAIDAVVDANLATDLDWVASKWWASPYARLWPHAYARIDGIRTWKADMTKALIAAGVTEPARHEAHFDDLFTFEQIERSYTAFAAWADAANGRVTKGSREHQDLLGLVHHAIQDFYCHTNWVEICLREQFVPVPTWEQVAADPVHYAGLRAQFARSNTETTEEPASSRSNPRRLGGLQSGAWTLKRFGNKQPWRHRHPEDGDPAHDPAITVAVAATKAWTERLTK